MCLGAEVTKTLTSVVRRKDGEVGGHLGKQETKGIGPLGQQGEKKRGYRRGIKSPKLTGNWSSILKRVWALKTGMGVNVCNLDKCYSWDGS